jgi:hypothetical protein
VQTYRDVSTDKQINMRFSARKDLHSDVLFQRVSNMIPKFDLNDLKKKKKKIKKQINN